MVSIQVDDGQHVALSEAILKEYNVAIRERGRFVLGVAGGSLVPLLAHFLPSLPINPSTLHMLLVDERNVPLSFPENTYNQYQEALPPRFYLKITFPIVCDGEATVEEAALHYEEILQREEYRMDLCILGMGPDGHVASLFPNHPAFLQESRSLVLPVHNAPKEPSERVTMSMRYLKSARRTLMVVKGREKAEMVKRIINGDKSLPAASLQVEWILDKDAASLLD